MSDPTRVTLDTLRAWPLPEPAVSEKHSKGVALVVAGSVGTPGAALLAAEAALRAGCGKVWIATVASAAAQLAMMVPEARVHGFEETPSGDLSPGCAADLGALAEGADATLIGPGFLDPENAEALVAGLLPHVPGPVVLDALGTAYLDGRPDLSQARGPCVLTMNPGELAQVLGLGDREIDGDLSGAVGRLAATSGAVVLLGGEEKLVASAGDQWAITAGGPGLATSGSGDVQAGLVTGLLARGAQPAQAAVWGAWLHAAAGDRLAARTGTVGFLARELAAEVPALLDV